MEDIDHIFEKGGITGGVLTSKGGRTVVPNQHRQVVGLQAEGKAENQSGTAHVENSERKLGFDDSKQAIAGV